MSELISFSELDSRRQELLIEAQKALANAYAPYSKYPVSAALLSHAGDIYLGVNLENASYGLTSCAEIGAFQSAISSGVQKFDTLVICGGTESKIATPCGRCRQIIHEMAEFSGNEIQIILSTTDLKNIRIINSSDLLPFPFGPKDLK